VSARRARTGRQHTAAAARTSRPARRALRNDSADSPLSADRAGAQLLLWLSNAHAHVRARTRAQLAPTPARIRAAAAPSSRQRWPHHVRADSGPERRAGCVSGAPQRSRINTHATANSRTAPPALHAPCSPKSARQRHFYQGMVGD